MTFRIRSIALATVDETRGFVSVFYYFQKWGGALLLFFFFSSATFDGERGEELEMEVPRPEAKGGQEDVTRGKRSRNAHCTLEST